MEGRIRPHGHRSSPLFGSRRMTAFALPSRQAYHKESQVSGCVGDRMTQNKEKWVVNAARVVMGRVLFLGLRSRPPLGGRMRGWSKLTLNANGEKRDLESASRLSHSFPTSLHQSRGVSSGGRSGRQQPDDTKITRLSNPVAVSAAG